MLTTDIGPQFSCAEFAEFSKEYGFNHRTSSPGCPQSNGEAERAVRTAKSILSQDDQFLALGTYRDTSIATTGKSPNALMLGRQVQTRLPCLEKKHMIKSPIKKEVKACDRKAKQK